MKVTIYRITDREEYRVSSDEDPMIVMTLASLPIGGVVQYPDLARKIMFMDAEIRMGKIVERRFDLYNEELVVRVKDTMLVGEVAQ